MTELQQILTDLRADSDEARGALAVLALLGLVKVDGGQAASTGEVAGFVQD